MSTVLGDTMGRFVERVSRDIPVEALTLSKALPAALSAAGNLPTSINPERDTSDIATTPARDLAEPVVFGLTKFMPIGQNNHAAVRATLPEVADGRLFHPDLVVPAKTVRGSRSSLEAGTPSVAAKSLTVPAVVQFRNAGHVLPCVRRHARRASILAKGHGGAHFVERKRNPDSEVKC